ncbi:MAG TPA: hypothetical protein VFM55_05355 [Micromonosporaceae bacterium]|nr:hypothetical protein [Micromonosporaceae bacterium]
MSGPRGREVEDLPVRLILDASAVCAFGRHETVGEVIGLVEQEDIFAVTTACLAEAVARGAEPALVDLLRSHPSCVVIGSLADWLSLGRFMDLTRPGATLLHDVADSDLTMLAVRTEAHILTSQPGRYTSIFDAVSIIELEKPWS